jgi:hypothetical protein
MKEKLEREKNGGKATKTAQKRAESFFYFILN